MPQVAAGSAPSGGGDAGLSWLGLPTPHPVKRGTPQVPSHYVPFLLGRGRSWCEVPLVPRCLQCQLLGAGGPAPRHLGWGTSQPDTLSLISFPLSDSGEDDSFLFGGTLKASNGRLFGRVLRSRAIFCPDSLCEFAIASCGFSSLSFSFFFFSLFSLWPLVCHFSKQTIFLMEALTVSCFPPLSSLTAWCELLRQTPLSLR